MMDSEIVDSKMSDENYKKKIKMIRETLGEIKKYKMKHYMRFRRLKRQSTLIKTAVNGLNAVSVCSIVLSLAPLSPVCAIVALSSTTVSGIVSAVANAYDLENKVHSHQTSYLQYTDVHREVSARLHRNGLSSADLDQVLGDLNARLGLIEDNSLPIKISIDVDK